MWCPIHFIASVRILKFYTCDAIPGSTTQWHQKSYSRATDCQTRSSILRRTVERIGLPAFDGGQSRMGDNIARELIARHAADNARHTAL